jgi:hypothetical protein
MAKESEGPETIETVTAARLGRREFTLAAALAMLSGVTITISGCGGGGGGGTGGGGPNQPNPPASGDKVGNISLNHGHTATIQAAELSAGAALTLQIRGSADHPHTLTLTAAEVQQIAAGQRVGRATSEDDFHTHTVTFN